ncbi:MAG: hypothetical protein ACKVP3_28010 [Hyphomicrobiaceae bacterium]
MNSRRDALQTLLDKADGDENLRQLLDALSQIEDALQEKDEFEASNLKLPYSSVEEQQNNVWK